MKLKEIFKSKNAETIEAQGNVIGIIGKDVTVNPSASQKLKRLHGRVERLGLSLVTMKEKGLTDTIRYKKFKQEYEYKLLKLQYNISREV